jgi:hypothetical protein
MARNKQRNFGSDWRSDENLEENDQWHDYQLKRDISGPDHFQRDYKHKVPSSIKYDDHHRGNFGGDRDYNRDYNLGTGTAMRMNRYESSPKIKQNVGFYGKGPKGWKRSDEKIRDEICEALNNSYTIDASDIEVRVTDGHVSLSGSVEDRNTKREVERLVDSILGVEDVQNNLQLNRKEIISEERGIDRDPDISRMPS